MVPPLALHKIAGLGGGPPGDELQTETRTPPRPTSGGGDGGGSGGSHTSPGRRKELEMLQGARPVTNGGAVQVPNPVDP
jgi:hypothetical protein